MSVFLLGWFLGTVLTSGVLVGLRVRARRDATMPRPLGSGEDRMYLDALEGLKKEFPADADVPALPAESGTKRGTFLDICNAKKRDGLSDADAVEKYAAEISDMDMKVSLRQAVNAARISGVDACICLGDSFSALIRARKSQEDARLVVKELEKPLIVGGTISDNVSGILCRALGQVHPDVAVIRILQKYARYGSKSFKGNDGGSWIWSEGREEDFKWVRENAKKSSENLMDNYPDEMAVILAQDIEW